MTRHLDIGWHVIVRGALAAQRKINLPDRLYAIRQISPRAIRRQFLGGRKYALHSLYRCAHLRPMHHNFAADACRQLCSCKGMCCCAAHRSKIRGGSRRPSPGTNVGTKLEVRRQAICCAGMYQITSCRLACCLPRQSPVVRRGGCLSVRSPVHIPRLFTCHIWGIFIL